VVGGQVPGDGEDPGASPAAPLSGPARRGPEYPQEHLLGQVLGAVGVSNPLAEKPEEPVLVAVDEGVEELHLAAADAAQELGAVGSWRGRVFTSGSSVERFQG
jgi:hypothetical protein